VQANEPPPFLDFVPSDIAPHYEGAPYRESDIGDTCLRQGLGQGGYENCDPESDKYDPCRQPDLKSRRQMKQPVRHGDPEGKGAPEKGNIDR
jgi:hypothetical protein